MKRYLVIASVVFWMLASCDTGTNGPSDPTAEEPGGKLPLLTSNL